MSMDLCRRDAGELGPTLAAGQVVSSQDPDDDADGAPAWEEEQTALEAIFGAEVSFPTCRSCCLAIRAEEVRARQGCICLWLAVGASSALPSRRGPRVVWQDVLHGHPCRSGKVLELWAASCFVTYSVKLVDCPRIVS